MKSSNPGDFAARIIANFVVFIILGAIMTFAAAVVLGADQCRDCDTGLGLCGIGYAISFVATPLLVELGYRFLLTGDEDASDDHSS